MEWWCDKTGADESIVNDIADFLDSGRCRMTDAERSKRKLQFDGGHNVELLRRILQEINAGVDTVSKAVVGSGVMFIIIMVASG